MTSSRTKSSSFQSAVPQPWGPPLSIGIRSACVWAERIFMAHLIFRMRGLSDGTNGPDVLAPSTQAYLLGEKPPTGSSASAEIFGSGPSSRLSDRAYNNGFPGRTWYLRGWSVSFPSGQKCGVLGQERASVHFNGFSDWGYLESGGEIQRRRAMAVSRLTRFKGDCYIRVSYN